MPLVVICGQPCSGKSTVAAKLKDMFSVAGWDSSIVDEPSLRFTRNASYQNTVNEKQTRGKLKSETERSTCKSAVTVLDSLNNIKGYRYELWCIARAAGTRYCMVHVDTPLDKCCEWNEQREGDKYSKEIFDDLAGRFERPDSKNRWDAPLFTVRAGELDEDEVLTAIVAAMTDTQPANPQQQVAKELAPTLATSNPTALQATNVLHEIDQGAQEVITTIMDAQSASAIGAPGLVQFGPGLSTLNIQQPITLAELRRHKRAFLKLATKITFARLTEGAAAKRFFVDYLKDNLQTG